MKDGKSYYQLLEVSQDADTSTLHMAFRRQSKTLHPDTTELPPDEAAKRFRFLCEAYETLADPQARHAYDVILKQYFSVQSSQLASSSKKTGSTLRGKKSSVGELRPLSGGEWFSLLLLGISLALSLLLGLGLALFNERAWQVSPSWLEVSQAHGKINRLQISNVAVATRGHSIKSAFIDGPREVAQ